MFLLVAFSGLPLFAQTPTNALPALAPPYGEIPPTFWERHGTAVLVSGIAVIALTLLLLWKLLQPKPAVNLPPEVVAREALTKLLRQPEDGGHLSEISQILRRCVAAAFGWPPGEMTTAEFITALANREQFGAELARTISDFLRECDARKFSPATAGPPLDAAARALEIVALVEKVTHRQDARVTPK
jgi:hypothetical protein